MLCCFPRPQGGRRRTPRRESTWARVRRWIARPRLFGPRGRNRPTAVGSTARVSPDPATTGSEIRGSPQRVSLGLDRSHLEPPSPGQVHLGSVGTIGNQAAESPAEVCTERTELAGADTQRTLTELPEQASLDSGPVSRPCFPEGSRANTSSSQDLMVGRSMSSILDSLLKLHSQVHHTAKLLLAQLEQAELTEAEPRAPGPAPAQAEVPPAESVPAPPASPSPALAPQREPVPGSPCAPAVGLGLLVAPQQGSAPELPLGPAPAPPLPSPCITVAHVLMFTFAFFFWVYFAH
ncbi:PREDICTED: translation initiation factor IF-2-like [Chinchilla lanigera]|uniref:translation initiation factor IF-2-like n=1 Tax=Chinchilla lanigera TaxID=34839 RepID=UPI00038EE5F7|nr:PREDICTED: translation initiation factor IF-2-like [Chinchilla lanigera]